MEFIITLLDQDINSWILAWLFFVVAFLYSSVGFGGGSSYLAILTLYGLAYADLRFIALLCNIVVVSGSVILYYRQGLYKASMVLSLVILSVPMAFLGGMIKLDEKVFFIILAITLIFAAILMWIPRNIDERHVKSERHVSSTLIGGGIGFLSGLVGIGGGIFLSPYLNLTKYDRVLRIAAFSSLFILVNSIAGILGQLTIGGELGDYTLVFMLVMAVFIGGQMGVRIGIKNLSPVWLKRITALLIAIVGARVLWIHLN
ncbi:MAG: putative membrane protein YfcA [Flavobacteriales bacterium]|jgi:uncharacterized membrane protein YfcA